MELKELYEKVQLKKRNQTKLDNLYTQREVIESKLSELEEKKRIEQEDVDRLERGNLSSFFYELTGKLDQKLDKERQEAYEAKAKYDASKHQLDAILNDIQYYETQQLALKNCESEYQTAYENKIEQLKKNDIEVVQLDEQYIACRLLQKEIEEAIQVGNEALRIAKQVKSKLGSADGWATWDVLGGGMLSHVMKYSAIDEAERLIQSLQTQLGKFQTELADVKINTNIKISIGEFLRFADYFFDNIFTDVEVMDRISKSNIQTEQTIDEIEKVLEILVQLLLEEKNKELELKDKLEKRIM